MVGEKVKIVHLNMLTLTLLRHAKTNQVSSTGSDYDRKLLPKGENQGRVLNEYFQKQGLKYDKILVSSAVRTTQTFEHIRSNFGGSDVEFLNSFYLCSQQELFQNICKVKDAKSLLIVGHNFGISDLACYLTEKRLELRTGELITLSFDTDSWNEVSKGTATIVDQFRPLV